VGVNNAVSRPAVRNVTRLSLGGNLAFFNVSVFHIDAAFAVYIYFVWPYSLLQYK